MCIYIYIHKALNIMSDHFHSNNIKLGLFQNQELLSVAARFLAPLVEMSHVQQQNVQAGDLNLGLKA